MTCDDVEFRKYNGNFTVSNVVVSNSSRMCRRRYIMVMCLDDVPHLGERDSKC